MTNILVQKLHPALRLGQQLAVTHSRIPLFCRQGDWDGGSTLHCIAMALALLGKLSDPVQVWRQANDSSTGFWDRAWPHYLHGLTLPELVDFIWELNLGVRPVMKEDNPAAILRFCKQELARGWPVMIGWHSQHPFRAHAALVAGIEGRQHATHFIAHALLLLDPAEPPPKLSACNARMEFGKGKQPLFVAAASACRVTIEGAVSLQLNASPRN